MYNINMNAIYITPYYDQVNKYYKNIIVIYGKPPDDIKNLTSQINLKPPSNYIDNYSQQIDCCLTKCVYAFKSECNTSQLMCVDEIPTLFNELMLKGYKIDTEVTKMMFQSEVKQVNKKLLCYISKMK